MTESTIPPGRVETLTADQEQVLKEIWSYYLHLCDYSIGNSIPVPTKAHRSSTITSSHSNGTVLSGHSSTVASTSTAAPKKKSLFGKFRKGHSKKKSVEESNANLTRILSRSESISPNISIDMHEKIQELISSVSKEDLKGAFWDHFLRADTPDNLVLRFVRARKWNIEKSAYMLFNAIRWRIIESKVDKILLGSELAHKDKKGFLLQFELGKAVIKGKDKKNRPIVIIRPRFHHSSDQTEEEMELYTLLVIEYARLHLVEPVDSCSILFDLSGFTMANMDYAPVKFMIKCFEAYYPESLGVLFIHKAPWIFSSIWNIIKNWLDPVVASKIVFTKTTDDLNKVIDLQHIPAELGGKDDFEWKYLTPTESENGLGKTDETELKAVKEERKAIADKFVATTISWIETSNAEESAKLLKERIQIGKELAENYKKLDPYIRNRSIYDRLGLLKL